jgi:hypothetical protein
MVHKYHILFKVWEIPCYNESQGAKDTLDEREPIRGDC